jgi:orotidine-5'-phosphate decarboxylase
MTINDLTKQIIEKKSYLCVGLDTDISKLPQGISKDLDGVLAFNKAIIEATQHLCVAYKPNIAFYEIYGSEGWDVLAQTMDYVPKNCFTIADGKRGDIGNTSSYYARTFFEKYNFDSATVAPYMGYDSVAPFLAFDQKTTILLALTSNKGAEDFQMIEGKNGEYLYETVLRKSQQWGNNIMYVVGATHEAQLERVRQIVPNHFLLIPGVGAQGGSLQSVSKLALNHKCGILINASRSILYASQGLDFAQAATLEAAKMQAEMAEILAKKSIVL